MISAHLQDDELLDMRSQDSSKLGVSNVPVNLELKLVATVLALFIADLKSRKSKKIESEA